MGWVKALESLTRCVNRWDLTWRNPRDRGTLAPNIVIRSITANCELTTLFRSKVTEGMGL